MCIHHFFWHRCCVEGLASWVRADARMTGGFGSRQLEPAVAWTSECQDGGREGGREEICVGEGVKRERDGRNGSRLFLSERSGSEKAIQIFSLPLASRHLAGPLPQHFFSTMPQRMGPPLSTLRALHSTLQPALPCPALHLMGGWFTFNASCNDWGGGAATPT